MNRSKESKYLLKEKNYYVDSYRFLNNNKICNPFDCDPVWNLKCKFIGNF